MCRHGLEQSTVVLCVPDLHENFLDMLLISFLSLNVLGKCLIT